MPETSTPDPAEAERGDIALHRSGDVRFLDRRKVDNSGWWLADGPGLDDRVLTDGDWMILTRGDLQQIWEERRG